MRITIRLDDHLLAEAKQRAARSGLTLSAVIEQALRESFSRLLKNPVKVDRIRCREGPADAGS